MTEAKINRAAVVRLYPNQLQASALRRWQGGLRYVWNTALDCVFTSRDINGRWPTKAEIQSLIVGMKKMEGIEWISDIPAHALLTLADDLQNAQSTCVGWPLTAHTAKTHPFTEICDEPKKGQHE